MYQNKYLKNIRKLIFIIIFLTNYHKNQWVRVDSAVCNGHRRRAVSNRLVCGRGPPQVGLGAAQQPVGGQSSFALQLHFSPQLQLECTEAPQNLLRGVAHVYSERWRQKKHFFVQQKDQILNHCVLTQATRFHSGRRVDRVAEQAIVWHLVAYDSRAHRTLKFSTSYCFIHVFLIALFSVVAVDKQKYMQCEFLFYN